MNSTLAAIVTVALATAADAQMNTPPELNYGAEAAATANNRTIGNFPLPLLYHHKGHWKVSVAPYLYSGDAEGTEFGKAVSGDLKGKGGAVSASYGLSEKWGLWGMVYGSKIEGDFVLTESARKVELTGVKASYVTAAAGFSRRFFGNEPGSFTMPVFFGVMLTKPSFEQSVKDTGTSDDSDFDVEGNSFPIGIVLGVQGAKDLGKWFMLNPFAVIGSGEGSKWEYTVGTVRGETGTGRSLLDSARNDESSKSPADIISFGVNLVVKPLGLSVNLTAPLLKSLSLVGNSSVTTTIFSISYSFGNYVK